MSHFINILIGWIAFACLFVLGQTGEARALRALNMPLASTDFAFLALVVASIFFLQYALDRYLTPPDVFSKEQRKRLLAAAQVGYRRTFFRGALGISYFFLICYVVGYLYPHQFVSGKSRNWMTYSAFFLTLGMIGRARGIILHLAGQGGEADKQLVSSPVLAGTAGAPGTREPDGSASGK